MGWLYQIAVEPRHAWLHGVSGAQCFGQQGVDEGFRVEYT